MPLKSIINFHTYVCGFDYKYYKYLNSNENIEYCAIIYWICKIPYLFWKFYYEMIVLISVRNLYFLLNITDKHKNVCVRNTLL